MALLNSTQHLLFFSEEMRHDSIRTISMFLIQKYLDQVESVVHTNMPLFLGVLAGYYSDCENPEDSLLLVKLLNLLVLAQLLEDQHSKEDSKKEEDLVLSMESIHNTLVQLESKCSTELKDHKDKLDILIAEAQCQVVLSHLYGDDLTSAADTLRTLCSHPVLSSHSKRLLSQLKDILGYVHERDSLSSEMEFSLHVFFTQHSRERLIRRLREFVSICYRDLNKKILRERSSSPVGHTPPADHAPDHVSSQGSGTEQEESGKEAHSSAEAAVSTHTLQTEEDSVERTLRRQHRGQPETTTDTDQPRLRPRKTTKSTTDSVKSAGDHVPTANGTQDSRDNLNKDSRDSLNKDSRDNLNKDSRDSLNKDSRDSLNKETLLQRTGKKVVAPRSAKLQVASSVDITTTTRPMPRSKKIVTWNKQLLSVKERSSLDETLPQETAVSTEEENVDVEATTSPRKTKRKKHSPPRRRVKTVDDVQQHKIRSKVLAGTKRRRSWMDNDDDIIPARSKRGNINDHHATTTHSKVVNGERHNGTKRSLAMTVSDVVKKVSVDIEKQDFSDDDFIRFKSRKRSAESASSSESGSKKSLRRKEERSRSPERMTTRAQLASSQSESENESATIARGGSSHTLRSRDRRRSVDKVSDIYNGRNNRKTKSPDSPVDKNPMKDRGVTVEEERRTRMEDRGVAVEEERRTRSGLLIRFEEIMDTWSSDDSQVNGNKSTAPTTSAGESRDADRGGVAKQTSSGIRRGVSEKRTPRTPEKRLVPASSIHMSPSAIYKASRAARNSPRTPEKSLSRHKDPAHVYNFGYEEEPTPDSHLPAHPSAVRFKPLENFLPRSERPISYASQARFKRNKFSAQETEYLQKGIEKFGFGNWKKILESYPFYPNRTSVSLKDKARNLQGRKSHDT